MTRPDPGAETRALTLDQLVLELARAPVSTLTHARFLDLAARLELDDELVARRTVFSAEAYARNLVCRTPELELLVLCWRPGQHSTIHDHAGSLNAIRVHSGELTSRVFQRADASEPGCGPVRLVSEEDFGAGDLTGLDRDGIHQLANATGEDLVTVHLYAPPLLDVTVYSTDSPGTTRQRLRYSVSDDLA